MEFLSVLIFCCGLGTVFAQGMDLLQLAEGLGAKTLVSYLVESGLDTAISSSGPFTVFAPTNEAFAALSPEVKAVLKKDPELLTKVLQYHVADGLTYTDRLYNDMLIPSLTSGLNMRVNTCYKRKLDTSDYRRVVTVNGVEVTLPDQKAINGVIHMIDKVLFPIPLGAIPQVVGENSNLSTLLYAVSQANLTDVLNEEGPFTLFAPSNAAFDRIPSEKLTELLADKTRLQHILKYHIVPGTFYSNGLSTCLKRTLYRSFLRITEGTEDLYVNHAKVVQADIPATNGVIHVIDKILIPRRC